MANLAPESLRSALADRYRIERELGAGGMATVYLAHDLRHDRKVAIKVLKPELAALLGAERFVVEIKTTAALLHPNILPLFDSGTADGFLFYVMPYIQGETIREKLNRETQFGVDEAVHIAREVADALDYAHRHGVIHRDIKPENILLHDGRAMVMDFGIALAVSAAAGGRMTETGLSLGTPHYMSPEQATAEKEISGRSDVYSLASVLYEMLAGQPPHLGGSAQQIIMKIIAEPVEAVTKFRKSVPPNVAAAVAKALEKLAADRFESAKAFANALGDPTYANAGSELLRGARPGGPRSVERALIAMSIVAVTATATAIWLATRPAPRTLASRFPVGLPDSVTLYTGGGTKLAVSKDGSKIVIVGVKDGRVGLYLRRIEDPVAQLVRGSGSDAALARYNVDPTFSPDGESIVYSDSRTLKRIPVIGGNPQTLEADGVCASWGEGGSILSLRRQTNDLWLGTPAGRDARLVARADTSAGIFAVSCGTVLPGGEHAIIGMSRSRARSLDSLRLSRGRSLDSLRLGVVSLRTGAITDLGVYGTSPRYVSSGHVIFGRAGGFVFVAPFSLRKRAITGPPSLLLENVWMGDGGAAGFSASDNGTLAYHAAAQSGVLELVAVSRAGAIRRIPGEARNFTLPRVSPDGRRIVAGSASDLSGISLVDATTGGHQQVVPADSGSQPEWTRDGSRIVFRRRVGGMDELVGRAPDRSRADTVLFRRPADVMFGNLIQGVPHGFAAVVRRPGPADQFGVYVSPMDSLGTFRPFATGSSINASPAISADGRLVAWVSQESGRGQVYVQAMPGPSLRILVDGGTEPLWSRTGATLFYRTRAKVMSAEIGGSPLRVTRRGESLFDDSFSSLPAGRNWDVFPGDNEFLMLRGLRPSHSEILVVLNWPQLRAAQKKDAARK